MSDYEQEKSTENALVAAIDNIINEKLRLLEARISAKLELLSSRIKALETAKVQVPTTEGIKLEQVVATVGGRKLYQEVLAHIEKWGKGKKFKLSALLQELESRIGEWSKLAPSTKKELTRTYLSWLRKSGKVRFSPTAKLWEFKVPEIKHREIVEPRIVLMKNKSFAVYKEVIDKILNWGENRKFSLRELTHELENAVAGWGMLQDTTLRSYASVHLRYLKERNQAHNIKGERAWVVSKEPSSQPAFEEPKPKPSRTKKVLGYVRRNPIHEAILVKIISKLKDLPSFSSKEVRKIVDEERAETSNETRRCLTYAYLKYLESNRIAAKTEEGYRIINTELLESFNRREKYESPSLFEDI